jgi:DNA invertase Pin-like site-specific DNA recombinase
MMTDRITATHLQRGAIVYVRQSSPEQVRNHGESTRIQIGLRDKAVAFGWRDPVTMVDDLGISAGGFAHRAGFQHMAAEVSLGKVGIILGRTPALAQLRTGPSCSRSAGTSIRWSLDLDQVYDLALPNDRLILGVKGSVSEYELSLFRQRSQAAIVAKAKRGALTFTLPAGLSWTPEGQIELHPDRRVQQAIRLVLDKLSAFGSVRQVLMWLRDERVALPTLESERPRAIMWRLPTYRMVLSWCAVRSMLGPTPSRARESRTRIVDGRATRTSGHQKPLARWTALIRDHHPGYISWEQFERNQRLLEENTHMKGTMARKAGRGGQCVLAGLLRCARCGRMLHVMYGRRGYARYECRQANRAEAAPRCIGFSARRPDETVSAEILAVAQGSALQAAIEAGDLASSTTTISTARSRWAGAGHVQAALAARRYDRGPRRALVAAARSAMDGALARSPSSKAD